VGPIGRYTTWQGQLSDLTGRTVEVEVTRTSLPEGHPPACAVYALHDVTRHAEINRMRERLLYDVAHELRAPLTVLGNALEILGTEYAGLSAREFGQLIGSARRTTLRLHNLMDGLLSAGSIQSGRFHVRPRPTPLAPILDEALEMVDPIIGPRGQWVERRLASDGLHVSADRQYVRQLLFNLLSNAAKYSPDGEVIRVETAQENGQVTITVEDRGPGIPADQQAGLFERFYRVKPGNEQPGTGLGLAIAKGIVEAHGGSIGVDSEPGAGTRVWFRLSAAPGPDEG
jgi:two-component system, NtrC family, sensor histidine kinase KinB